MLNKSELFLFSDLSREEECGFWRECGSPEMETVGRSVQNKDPGGCCHQPFITSGQKFLTLDQGFQPWEEMCEGPIHTYCVHISPEVLKAIHGIPGGCESEGKNSKFLVKVDPMSAKYHIDQVLLTYTLKCLGIE